MSYASAMNGNRTDFDKGFEAGLGMAVISVLAILHGNSGFVDDAALENLYACREKILEVYHATQFAPPD